MCFLSKHNRVNIRALTELSNTYMILFDIGVFLTSKILEHTIDDIFHSFENPSSMSLQVS